MYVDIYFEQPGKYRVTELFEIQKSNNSYTYENIQFKLLGNTIWKLSIWLIYI